MKVSAIVPTFNRARLLPRALASIAAQTHPDVEVIVVDDGSTDDTAEVVHRIAATFPFPFHYFRKPNGGCASARNAGLRQATGECIAFLDSDDAWNPDALAQLAAALERTGADFVYSPSVEILEDGGETLNRPVAAGDPERLAVEHFTVSNLRNGSTLIRRSALHGVGEFDESLGHNEDSDFVQRLAIRCKATYVDASSVRVFHHGGRKSDNRVAVEKAVLASTLKILATHPDFARSLGERADRRLRQIRASLVAQLILADQIAEARAAAREGADLGSITRLALVLGSPRPLRLARRLRRCWQRLRGD